MLAAYLVNTELDSVDPNDGLTSLREAITSANGAPSADTINFDASLSGKTILLTHGELKISDDLTVSGLGAGLLRVDAQQQSRIFNFVGPTGDLAISNLTLTNGHTTGSNTPYGDNIYGGGAIRSATAGELTLTGVVITGCSTSGFGAGGGAVNATGPHYVSPGDTTIRSCTITGNSTTGQAADGGGVFVGGRLNISDSYVINNKTTGQVAHGGGILADQEIIALRCTISSNQATGGSYGGGIFTFAGIDLSDSAISGNVSMGFGSKGGGIYAKRYSTIVRSSFVGNTASGPGASGGGMFCRYDGRFLSVTITDNYSDSGGGVCVDGGAYFEDCNISGNTAVLGGGLSVEHVLTLSDCVVSNNKSTGNGAGGGIFANSTARIVGSLIKDNSAAEAGGIYGGGLPDGGRPSSGLTLISSTVSGNSAWHDGGGGIVAVGDLTTINSTISDNKSLKGGGGAACIFGNLSVYSSTITNNVATNGHGGGISTLDGSMAVYGSIIAGNVATDGNPDVRPGAGLSVKNSIVGNNAGTTLIESFVADANGNLIGGLIHGVIDPLLGPLSYNGGLTFIEGSKMLTRSPLHGSPVIDAGDPSAVVGSDLIPLHDGRGAPFNREFGGRIDMGAFEVEPTGFLAGDYNGDGFVDAADYTLWRDTMGATVVAASGADGNGDGVVDAKDYAVWAANFGETLPAGAGSGVGSGEFGMGSAEFVQASSEVARIGEDPLPLDDSRPLRKGEVRIEVALTLRQVLPRPALGALGVPPLAVSSSRDDALLVWLAGREEGRSIRQAHAGKAEGPPQRVDSGGKAESKAGDDSAEVSVGAMDDVFAGLGVGV
ncbi:MAG TPA: choice-of-anchor Q domain-containing protein [Lacipirellulaceae bacterium]|jgi:hypothetical protein